MERVAIIIGNQLPFNKSRRTQRQSLAFARPITPSCKDRRGPSQHSATHPLTAASRLGTTGRPHRAVKASPSDGKNSMNDPSPRPEIRHGALSQGPPQEPYTSTPTRSRSLWRRTPTVWIKHAQAASLTRSCAAELRRKQTRSRDTISLETPSRATIRSLGGGYRQTLRGTNFSSA